METDAVRDKGGCFCVGGCLLLTYPSCELKLPYAENAAWYQMQGFFILPSLPLLSGVLHLCFFPPIPLPLFISLQFLSSLVPVMHVRALRRMRGEERVRRPRAWKDSVKLRKGGERKSSRPITPSEHLKLLPELSSAAPHISPPISANPTGLPGLDHRWKHLFLFSLVFNFLQSFVPCLFFFSLH